MRCGVHCDNGSPISVRYLPRLVLSGLVALSIRKQLLDRDIHVLPWAVINAKMVSSPLVFRVMGNDMRGLRREERNGGFNWKSACEQGVSFRQSQEYAKDLVCAQRGESPGWAAWSQHTTDICPAS